MDGLTSITGRLRRSVSAAVIATAMVALTACGGGDDDTSDPQSTVSTVSWDDQTGFQLPASEGAGPGQWEAGIPSGFSHDTAGAVMAAANLSIALDVADQKSFGDVLAATTVDDAGRAAWANARAGLEIGDALSPNKVPTLIGWAGDGAATGEAATVFLYWKQYDGSLTEQRRELVWQDDWKLALPDNPQVPQIRAVETLPDTANEFDPQPPE